VAKVGIERGDLSLLVTNDGTSFEITFNNTYIGEQIGWFKSGSSLNTIKTVN